MSFLKSRQLSSAKTGMTAGQWLQTRNEEKTNKGVGQNKTDKKYSFLEDTSSDDSLSATQFLKTKKSEEDVAKEEPKEVPASTRPKTSRGFPEKKTNLAAAGRANTALDRFAQLEKQIRERQSTLAKTVVSSSDMDLNISSDSEVNEDISKLKKLKEESKQTTKEPAVVNDRKEQVDKAVKKVETKVKVEAGKRKLKDDEKAVSPSPYDDTFTSASEASLDDFMTEKRSDDVSLDDVLPDLKTGVILSFDELKPASISPGKFLSPSRDGSDLESNNSVTSTDRSYFQLHSVGELMDGSRLKPSTQTTSKKSTGSSLNDAYSDDFHSDSDDTLKATESITEEESSIVEEAISYGNEVQSSLAEEVPSEDSYDETFESISSSTRSKSSQSSSESSSVSTESSRSIKRSRVKSRRVIDVGVQTDLAPPTDRQMEDEFLSKFTETEKSFFSPRHIINNEALSVLSSYSPTVLALQEMLKQQLQFTRDFIARSERLHSATGSTLIADYQYASLEEAKETINKRREKLNLPPKYPRK